MRYHNLSFEERRRILDFTCWNDDRYTSLKRKYRTLVRRMHTIETYDAIKDECSNPMHDRLRRVIQRSCRTLLVQMDIRKTVLHQHLIEEW